MAKQSISNSRMFRLMAFAIAEGKANNEKDFCEKIEFAYQNLANIRALKQSFTIGHITNACKFTGASANWILGLDDAMMRKPGKNVLQRLKEVVAALEMEEKK